MFARPPHHHLAQINVALAQFDMDDPQMEGFTGKLDLVNDVAERSPGFVWRLKSDAGNALDIQVSDDPRFIINMSVWEDGASLQAFVWKTVHVKVYEQREKWFPPKPEAMMALWWVPIGHQPSADEGMARLTLLREKGPHADAFGWAQLA